MGTIGWPAGLLLQLGARSVRNCLGPFVPALAYARAFLLNLESCRRCVGRKSSIC